MYIKGVGNRTMENIYNGIAKASGNSPGLVKASYSEISRVVFKWAREEGLEVYANRTKEEYIQIAYKIGSAVIALPTRDGRDYCELYFKILYYVIDDSTKSTFTLDAKIKEICDFVEENYEKVKETQIPRANLILAGLTYYDRITRQAWEKVRGKKYEQEH